jgi:hypothetical protein
MVEQLDELSPVRCAEALKGSFVVRHHWRLEAFEQRCSLGSDPAEVLPTVIRAAFPADVVLGFEAIEKPGHARCFFNHARRDFECGQARFTRSAKNPEYVVLLQRDSVRLDHASSEPPHQVGSPHQRHNSLVSR